MVAALLLLMELITGGADYEPVSQVITFTNVSSQQFRVIFRDDDAIESTEQLGLVLNSSDNAVILNPMDARVNILDDDGQCFFLCIMLLS